ncbi:MAG: SH3 domain-containing protein [Treponema sp.]|nr:SH3 domain-containing protein [Treponema sp.]
MKSIFKKVILLFALISTISFGYAKPSKKPMYIAMDPAPLREKASAVSTKVGELNYGDEVLVLQEKKNWSLICLYYDDSVQGWIPNTALSKKKIVANGSKTSADADEIALAGKGFNSTIEAVYAEEYEIDYSQVDYVESQSVSEAEIEKFAKEGKLFLGEIDD